MFKDEDRGKIISPVKDTCNTVVFDIVIAIGVIIVSCILDKKKERDED